MFRLNTFCAFALCALTTMSVEAATSGTAPLGFAEARTLLHERADIMQVDRAEIARA